MRGSRDGRGVWLKEGRKGGGSLKWSWNMSVSVSVPHLFCKKYTISIQQLLKTTTIITIINVRFIDRKVLSNEFSSFVLLQLCLIKVNNLFTLSYIDLFQL